MNEQRRSTKKVLKVLTVIGVILILALIGAVVYFYAIGEISERDDVKREISCGCYLIDPAVVNDCGDPKKAVLFSIKRVPVDQVCSVQCNTNKLSEYILNSETPENSYKSCTVRNISDSRCEEMILKDQKGRLITGKISSDDEINVEATFDKSTYKDYTFSINTDKQDPDKIEGEKIFKKISDFDGVNSVEILATATDSRGDQINSIICRRVVEISSDSGSSVSALSAITERQIDGRTKISQISVSIGQLTSEDVKIRFSFGTKYSSLTAINGMNVEVAKGSIKMSKADLYDSSNFAEGQSFSILDNHIGELDITAEVFVEEVNVGNASTKVTFATPSEEEQPPPATEPEVVNSNFAVSKAAIPACVERTEDKNTATFTITVKNNKTEQDGVTSIKDKLPLGFKYVTESTIINGSAVTDTSVVNITTIGSTQEIVWQQTSPWQVPAGGQLVISFKATADSEALTGQNLNEVIINPVEIPADPATLRSEVGIVVAQDCDNPPITPGTQTPSTGILDNVVVRIILGIILFATGWIVYTRPEGTKLSEIIVGSNVYKGAELTKYRFTNPRKYFEEKILRTDTKEKK